MLKETLRAYTIVGLAIFGVMGLAFAEDSNITNNTTTSSTVSSNNVNTNSNTNNSVSQNTNINSTTINQTSVSTNTSSSENFNTNTLLLLRRFCFPRGGLNEWQRCKTLGLGLNITLVFRQCLNIVKCWATLMLS